MEYRFSGVRMIRALFLNFLLGIAAISLLLICTGTLHAESDIRSSSITIRDLQSDPVSLLERMNFPLIMAQSDKPDEIENLKPREAAPQSAPKQDSDEYGDVTPEDVGVSGNKTSDEYGDVTTEEELQGAEQVNDPIKPFNVAMYHFNDKLYFWAWKPVATGYKTVVPEEFRVIFGNFYENLKAPIRIFNNLFQGDPGGAGSEFMSLLINSTIGVGGLRNCAQECFGIQRDYADFGQTLGKWGFGYGFYLVLPFLGPSSAREGVGTIVDWPMKPTSWLGSEFLSPETIGLYIHDNINFTSFHLGEYEALKEAAIDPYVAMRDIFIQYRNNLIKKK
ncbi:MAG: MlaA family lipoprotein [Syntrophorhabdaceae bacterium]